MQATTWNTGKFLGWYDGNTLLSSQPEYRFAVKDHTTITAKFNEINFHSYTLKVEGGGTIQQDEYEWPANASLPMEATPDEGYEFVCWTSSNGGTFENASDSVTSFTMPDHDTEITAHFRKIGEKPDLNKDDTVNMADVVMLFRYVSEDAPEALDETKLLAADMDADGTLTLTDLKLLLASLTAA